MTSLVILIFVIGYLSITLEHPLKLDKTVPALIMAALIWAVLAIGFHAGWFDIIDTHENVFNFLTNFRTNSCLNSNVKHLARD